MSCDEFCRLMRSWGVGSGGVFPACFRSVSLGVTLPDSTLRQIVLLQLLPRRAPGLTSTELQQRLSDRGFPIHLRSVQRDLDRLSSQFGFTNDEQTPPRWFWTPGSSDLSLPAQDPHSALTWRLIEQYLEPLLPPALRREADSQFRAARQVLETAVGGRLLRWHSRVRLLSRSLPLTPPDIPAGILECVYSSLLQERQLFVTYKARGATEQKIFRVHPLALVVRESVYYLVATANDYSDVIQMALHRIQKAEVTPDKAAVPADFDLESYIKRGGFLYSEGEEISLVARFDAYTAQHLHECQVSTDQVLVDLPDGRVELRAPVLHSQQLLWWLMGFGDKVEVVEPAELRRQLAKQYEALHQKYSE